jgi:hypothetical protein
MTELLSVNREISSNEADKDKIIQEMNCKIDSLETLLSVYRRRESERKPSRDDTASNTF